MADAKMGWLDRIVNVNFGAGDFFRVHSFMGSGSDTDPSGVTLFKPQPTPNFNFAPQLRISNGNTPGPGITSITKAQLPFFITASNLKQKLVFNDGSTVGGFGCFFPKSEATDQSGSETFVYIEMPASAFYVAFSYDSSTALGQTGVTTYAKNTAFSGAGMAIAKEPTALHEVNTINIVENGQQIPLYHVDVPARTITPPRGNFRVISSF